MAKDHKPWPSLDTRPVLCDSLYGVIFCVYTCINISSVWFGHGYSFSRIGTLYFDGDKLKDWSAASQQTMALFERIRTVGKGTKVP